MNDKHEPRGEVPGKIRKPYRTPVVRHEKVFETQALSCGKISTTQAQCKSNRKNS